MKAARTGALLHATLLGFALLTPVSAVKAQQAPAARQSDEDEVVRITSNLVQVDAVITDGQGRPVTDLKPGEVLIYEDGRPQKVTHFSYVAAETALRPRPTKPSAIGENTTPPVNLRPRDVRRTIALVVDDLGLSFESTHYVRRALKKFVDEQMQPGDLVAIIRTGGGIGALQQFTSDKRQLYAAIERVKWYAGGRAGLSAFAPMEAEKPGRFWSEVEAANEDLNKFREDVFAVGTLGAVNYVVKGLQELPGRKSILLISDGFRIYNRADPTRNARTLQKLRQLVDQANRAAVVIYTMNATGLQTLSLNAADAAQPGADAQTGGSVSERVEQSLSDRRADAFETQAGLDFLAEETGGIAVRHTNDLSGGIQRVLDEQRGYYLIGYRPGESTFDPKTGRRMFHRLSLKVTRPGRFNVRMRDGFYGVADADASPPPRTPRDQIVNALVSPFGASGVHVQLTSIFANEPEVGSFMRSMLHVDAGDLTFKEEADGWRQTTFDVVAVTFDDSGGVVDQISRTHTMRLRGEGYRQILKEGFVFLVIFPIKRPGAYQLRAALRDHDSERVGSASQFVEIPDLKKGRLALSGLVLSVLEPAEFRAKGSGAIGAIPQHGTQSNPGTGSPSPAAGQPDPSPQDEGTQTPDTQAAGAARRIFRQGTQMRYGFVIYNARLDKATRTPQLQIQARLFRGGQPVFTGKVQPLALNNPPDLNRLSVESSFRLGADMSPGEYVLQVIVTDLLADEKHRAATQWMDFEIEQ